MAKKKIMKPYYASTFLTPGKVFHRSDKKCRWGNRILKRNLREFESHDEAVDAGFKPCKTCRA